MEPTSSNHDWCSILRRFHIGFSFWPCWLPLGIITHTLLLSKSDSDSFCAGFKRNLWERGEEVLGKGREKDTREKKKLYNILLSLFVNSAVYGVF